MQIKWKKYRLPLADTFTISKGSFSYRDALIIELSQDGLHGLGETTEISYYHINLDRFIQLIELNKLKLSSLNLTNPQTYHEKIKSILGDEPFLISAFDCAAHDLFGKIQQKPTRELFTVDAQDKIPLTSYTIGLNQPEAMIAKIKKKSWPIYKIKLGGAQDMEIMQKIRLETSAVLRIDANEGWDETQCVANAQILRDLEIELIEQPLPRSSNDKMLAIKHQSALPLIADESCHTLSDVSLCQDKFHGINIKLMKCGGITPALKMIEEARALDLQVMIGCMTETSIGISAAAQLIPLVDYVDLDGAMLIKSDIASGVVFDNGEIQFLDVPGFGCELIQQLK